MLVQHNWTTHTLSVVATAQDINRDTGQHSAAALVSHTTTPAAPAAAAAAAALAHCIATYH
jgi:hypothetical protein